MHELPVHAIVLGFLSAVAATMTYLISLDAYQATLPSIFFAFLLLSQICPFPFGLLSGILWRGRHPIAYIVIGLSAGLVSLLGHMAVKGSKEIVPAQLVPGWEGWDRLLLPALFLFGATLMFLAGGLVGDRLEDRINRSIKTGVLVEDLDNIREVVKLDKTHKERLALIKDLGPAVLTLIGTISSSSLAFLAAALY
jgi:hypothetical protein